MRIALVSDCYLPTKNGVVTSIRELAAGLLSRGHSVLLITAGRKPLPPQWRNRGEWGLSPERGEISAPSPEEDPRARQEKALRVYRFPSLPVLPSVEIEMGFARTGRLEEIFRSERIEVVHTHTEFPLARAALRAAGRLGLPCIHTLHTTYREYLHYLPLSGLLRGLFRGYIRGHIARLSRTRKDYVGGMFSYSFGGEQWFYRFWRQFLSRYRAVVCPSSHVRDFVEECMHESRPGLHTPLVPNGIDISRIPRCGAEEKRSIRAELGFSDSDTVLLYSGRLSKEKRSRELAETLIPLLRKKPRLKWLVIGGGPDETRLRSSIEKNGLQESVRCTGYIERERALRCYTAGDIFITASLSENHPVSLIEAQAAGLPVLARRSPGISSMVEDGESGILLDSDEEIADAVETVLGNEKLREKMSASARRRALTFSSDRHTEEMLGVYKSLYTAYGSSSSYGQARIQPMALPARTAKSLFRRS